MNIAANFNSLESHYHAFTMAGVRSPMKITKAAKASVVFHMYLIKFINISVNRQTGFPSTMQK